MILAFSIAARLPPSILRWAGRVQLRFPLVHRWIQRLRPSGVVTIQHGLGKGLKIIANAESNVGYALGTTEPQVQDFFAAHLRPGDVVYDIGANVGFFTLIAAKMVGPTGRVYSFEPVPSTAQALRKNIALNRLTNVDVIEAAVGRSSGTGTLILGQSSLDARLDPDGGDGSGLAVPVVSIDDSPVDRHPTFVKIDAEGAEFDVLDGMRQTLATTPIPTILCELHQEGDRDEHLAAFASALRDLSVEYTLSLLEDGDDWWAPHAVALPAACTGRT